MYYINTTKDTWCDHREPLPLQKSARVLYVSISTMEGSCKGGQCPHRRSQGLRGIGPAFLPRPPPLAENRFSSRPPGGARCPPCCKTTSPPNARRSTTR